MRTSLVAALAAALVLASAAGAASPSAGTVSPESSTASWTGGPFVTSQPTGACIAGDPACDRYALTIVPPDSGDSRVEIAITTQHPDSDDFDLFVHGPDGAQVASSTTPSGNERVVLENPAAGTYSVRVVAWLVAPGATYDGKATLTVGAPPVDADPRSVLWNYDRNAPQASVDVPLRVVMVGFKPGEIDAAKALAEIPDHQRPGVLIPRGTGSYGDATDLFGLDTLVNHGRGYYDSSRPFLVPYEYRWKPEVHFAPRRSRAASSAR